MGDTGSLLFKGHEKTCLIIQELRIGTPEIFYLNCPKNGMVWFDSGMESNVDPDKTAL